jgi:hypothetical protein
MTDYAVTAVWDIDSGNAPEPFPGLAATSDSYGRLATTLYLSADNVQEAQAEAFERFSGSFMWETRGLIAMSVKPVSTTPHFVFGAMGR